MTEPRYAAAELAAFVAEVLLRLGLGEDDARIGAGVLLDADLTGVDTHGIANFATHDHYAKGLRRGVVNPRPEIAVLRDAPVAAAWDSDGGFGPLVAHQAMSAAIEKAEQSGIGMVTVCNARHFGANGYFAEMAAKRGMLAMVTSNTPVGAFPPGAERPVVGPNPLAFAAPVADGPPLVLDVSMTAVAATKVTQARLLGRDIPPGWLVDADGRPTTDPDARAHGGGLELLGGQVAGHKGFGLALMVDTLGMLAGNGSGIWQTMRPAQAADPAPATWTQGQWFAAWRVDLFVDADEFAAELARVAAYLHETATHDGAGLKLPGERRAASRTERSRDGIPLPAAIVGPLAALAAELKVSFPLPLG